MKKSMCYSLFAAGAFAAYLLTSFVCCHPVAGSNGISSVGFQYQDDGGYIHHIALSDLDSWVNSAYGDEKTKRAHMASEFLNKEGAEK